MSSWVGMLNDGKLGKIGYSFKAPNFLFEIKGDFKILKGTCNDFFVCDWQFCLKIEIKIFIKIK